MAQSSWHVLLYTQSKAVAQCLEPCSWSESLQESSDMNDPMPGKRLRFLHFCCLGTELLPESSVSGFSSEKWRALRTRKHISHYTTCVFALWFRFNKSKLYKTLLFSLRVYIYTTIRDTLNLSL